MDTKKDFNKFATNVFGEEFGKKQFNNVSLSDGAHPSPLEVNVDDERNSLVSDSGFDSLHDKETNTGLTNRKHRETAKDANVDDNAKHDTRVRKKSRENVPKRKKQTQFAGLSNADVIDDHAIALDVFDNNKKQNIASDSGLIILTEKDTNRYLTKKKTRKVISIDLKEEEDDRHETKTRKKSKEKLSRRKKLNQTGVLLDDMGLQNVSLNPLDGNVYDKKQDLDKNHKEIINISVDVKDEHGNNHDSRRRKNSKETVPKKKKQYRAIGLFDNDAADSHPSPLDVIVYDKKHNLVSEPGFGGLTKKSKETKRKPLSYQDKHIELSFDRDSGNGSQCSNHNDDSLLSKMAPLQNKHLIGAYESDSDFELTYFCVDHMQMCKSRSEKHKHRNCNYDILDRSRSPLFTSSLSGSSGSFAGSNREYAPSLFSTQATETLKKMYDYSGVMIHDREDLKEHLCARKAEIEEEMYSFMEDFIELILKRKQDVLSKIENLHDKNLMHATEQNPHVHRFRHEARMAYQALQLPSSFDDFKKYKEIIYTAKDKAETLEEIGRKLHSSATRWAYEFRPSPDVERTMDLKYIGHVTSIPDIPIIPPFLSVNRINEDASTGNVEDASVPTFEQFTCIEGAQSNGIPSCGFTGCAYVTTEALLLADWNNGSIKMYNKIGVVMDKLEFEKSPWDVTRVCDGQAVVTVPNLQTVFFVECDTHLRIVESFNTKCECFGICKLNDNFAIACDPWCKSPSVRIFTRKGVLLSCFQTNSDGEQLFKCPMHVCVDYFNTAIYVSDATANCVFAFSVTGSIKFVYQHPELHYPTGVATDRNNCLYVCGKESANIQQISNSGTIMDVVVRQRNGIQCPRAICCHPDGGHLIITDLEGPNANGYLKKALQ